MDYNSLYTLIDGQYYPLSDFRFDGVVEIVRCKDCIWWNAYNGVTGIVGYGSCDEFDTATTPETFYCAAGTRRNNNAK